MSRRERFWRRGRVGRISHRIVVMAAAGSVAGSVFYSFWALSDLDRFMTWLSCSGAVVGILLARLGQTAKLANATARNIRMEFEKRLSRTILRTRLPEGEEDPIGEKVKEHLVPRVEVLSGLAAVCGEGARAIERAHRAKDDQDRFITFYGSASLSTVHEGSRRYGERRVGTEEDEDTQTPEQIYRGALEAAATDQVRMRRYIRLFAPEELRQRGLAFQEEYVGWLREQERQLKRNPNYRLTQVLRAPLWGGNVARIVTYGRLLELVGNGDAGLLLVGEDISDAVRRHGRASMLGDEVRNEPQHYGQERPPKEVIGSWHNVDEFRHRILAPAEDVVRQARPELEH